MQTLSYKHALTSHFFSQITSHLQPRATGSKLDEKISTKESAKEYACQWPRRPLNKLFRRAVQCRDQSVVSCLYDRIHPNKVSMKKKRKGEEAAGEQGIFIHVKKSGGKYRRLLLISDWQITESTWLLPRHICMWHSSFTALPFWIFLTCQVEEWPSRVQHVF